jgi:hypothetical protein
MGQDPKSRGKHKRPFRPAPVKEPAAPGPAPAVRMPLTKLKPHRSGALVGFASVKLPSGLLLIDYPLPAKRLGRL